MKNFLKIALAAIIGLACATEMKAADTYNANGLPVYNVNTTTTTNLVGTNLVVTGTSKGASGIYWTNSITAGTVYTNITTLPNSSQYRDLCIQFQANLNVTNATITNVVWTVARSVTGQTPTNQFGGGTQFELAFQVTNTIQVNNTASDVVVVNLSSVNNTHPKVNVLSQMADGAVPYFYIYSVSSPAQAATNLTAASVVF